MYWAFGTISTGLGFERLARLSGHANRVRRFNANGPDGLLDGKALCPPRVLAPSTNGRWPRSSSRVQSRRHPGMVRWRIVDSMQWLFDEYGVSVSTQTLSRDLRAMGYRKLTARPRHHAQGADASGVF